eukprot:jgi/Ulvmu1/2824/UM142_0022.1
MADAVVFGESQAADVDTFFILISGFLVFFMHCGFCMLSVGAVRSKNAKNIILKILLDACFGALAFYLCGFAFAYGGTYGDAGGSNAFIGWGGFALNGLPKADWYMWFFQFAFAATAATIVSGAVAERTRFEAYILYACLLTAWVYPVVVHWVWSADGWASPSRATDRLLDVGVIDFAGCAAVHMIGGLSGLAGAYIVGPRIGRFGADGRPTEMPGHNASLAILGVFILWFGWYGFNPGSALAILGKSSVAAVAAVNTTLSAAAGTLSTLFALMAVNWLATGEVIWDLLGTSNGTLAGLVGITAACSVVEPWAAIVIGCTAGFVYVFAAWFVPNVLKIDDPLEAGAVHAFTGAWGLLMAAAFAHKPSVAEVYGDEVAAAGHGFLLSGGNGRMLGAALAVIAATLLWTLAHMVPFFYVMRALGLLRVAEAEELVGLDKSHHGGSAYELGLGEKIAMHEAVGGMEGSRHNNIVQRLNNLESRNTDLERQLTALRGTVQVPPVHMP